MRNDHRLLVAPNRADLRSSKHLNINIRHKLSWFALDLTSNVTSNTQLLQSVNLFQDRSLCQELVWGHRCRLSLTPVQWSSPQRHSSNLMFPVQSRGDCCDQVEQRLVRPELGQRMLILHSSQTIWWGQQWIFGCQSCQQQNRWVCDAELRLTIELDRPNFSNRFLLGLILDELIDNCHSRWSCHKCQRKRSDIKPRLNHSFNKFWLFSNLNYGRNILSLVSR